MIDSYKIAWAAGFIDGEGCIIMAKSYPKGAKLPTYRVDVIVANAEEPPLYQLHRLFGGRIGMPKKATDKQRASYEWRSTGSAHAARTLKILLPYFLIKGPQAVVAIEAASHFGTVKHPNKNLDREKLEELKLRLQDLKRRDDLAKVA